MSYRAFTFTMLVALSSLAGASDGKMESLISAAQIDPAKRPQRLSALMNDHLYIIASWESPESKTITFQNFMRDGKSFIPVFSDEAHFKAEIAGSDFEMKGVSIDAHLFASMLSGIEMLILNPGSNTPTNIHASELKALINPEKPTR